MPDTVKDFKITQGGRSGDGKGKTNKKLADEAVQRVKETGDVSAEDYLMIAEAGREGDVQTELSKAKTENSLAVPNTFYELSLQEQSMLMYYLSTEFRHPITRKRTHMNMLQSYITTFLDEDEIFKIWEKEERGKIEDGTYYVTIGAVRNYTKLNEVKLQAMKTFNQNRNITEAWNDLVQMTFGINPEDLLKTVILQDALTADDYRDKNANRKMALEVLGMGKDETNVQFNVFSQGGGAELASTIKKYADDEHLVTEDDFVVEDDD